MRGEEDEVHRHVLVVFGDERHDVADDQGEAEDQRPQPRLERLARLGVEQKTIGVRRSGIDVFLVPAGENAAVARRYAHGLRIVPVHSFRQALRALATL